MFDQSPLDWPPEVAAAGSDAELSWHDDASNQVLDFHGAPDRAGLTLFSDGNHHMALAETLRAFVKTYPEVVDVFYATLPPHVLLQILKSTELRLGNLRFSLKPTAFIGPKPFIDQVASLHFPLARPRRFARSDGQAVLISKGNPKQINSTADLLRNDVLIFISNPIRERASFDVYLKTIQQGAEAEGFDAESLCKTLEHGGPRIVHGQHVHHREAPKAVASGEADVAVLYKHLAMRYCRIFQDRFDMIEIPAMQAPIITEYFVAPMENDPWGERLASFMFSSATQSAYLYHGLIPLDPKA